VPTGVVALEAMAKPPATTPTRLEFSDGTSHKFWQIEQSGKTLHSTWGRIGTAGQGQAKTYATPEAARKELEKQVASKRQKGYAEVGQRAATSGAKSAPTKTKTKTKTEAKPKTKAKTPVATTPPPPSAEPPRLRPRRTVSLMELSGLGQMGPELDEALKYPERAHFVQYADADKKLRKFPRLRKLELSDPVPSWVGDLTSLRTLIGTVGKKLPASLFTLPHLRFLHLDGSDELADLRGLDKLRALETVTCGDSALSDEELAAAAKQLGATVTSFMPGLDFKRVPPKPPRDRKAIVAAMNADTLADGSDLRGVDLSGATFEHVYVTHDLRGANLANTVWRSCDFEWCQASGADLSGATFEDCYFQSSMTEGLFEKAKAQGVTFIGCGGDLYLQRADLRDAKLLDLESDVHLDLTRADARGLTLWCSFASEKEHQFSAKGADLRGAQLHLDVSEGRRAELKKKKTARLAWATDHFKGAKTDKTTRIEYATLDARATGPATRPAQATVMTDGPAAKILGTMYAPNAGLWMVVADADLATQWRGSVDEDDPKDDFQRALEIDDRRIAIGDGHGLCLQIGHRSGWSHLFERGDEPGLHLVDAALSLSDRAARDRAIALRVGQWRGVTKPKVIGKVACPSGVLALLLPFRDGAFPAAMRKQAKKGVAVVEPRDHDRALVGMTSGPGLYEVTRTPFRPDKGKGDYEDELGEYGDLISIRYCGSIPGR